MIYKSLQEIEDAFAEPENETKEASNKRFNERSA